MLDFYHNFDVKNYGWALDWKLPLVTSILYLIVSYGLKSVLGTEKKAEPNEQSLDSKKNKDGIIMYSLTQLHNLILIGLSFSMMCGIVYEIYKRSLDEGIFRGAICPDDDKDSKLMTNGPLAFWVFVYHISKYYELVDTLLIVLKKKPLIILHVYHHLIMIWITWSWLVDPWLIGSWWCIFVNPSNGSIFLIMIYCDCLIWIITTVQSLIHTIMYYYYLQAARGKVLRWKNILTGGQIVQLFSGFLLVSYWFLVRDGNNCSNGLYAGIFSHLVNGTLILQFVRFFYINYIAKKKRE